MLFANRLRPVVDPMSHSISPGFATPYLAPDAHAQPPASGLACTLTTTDGRALAATWHEPSGRASRAVAVVSSATGVPRGYYFAFAQWLAMQGYAVLTYDYRGIGGSLTGPPRREPATMADWALRDMGAALAAARARRSLGADRLPLLLVGHSFGGNCIAFAPGVREADALLMVASPLGEPRLYPGRHRWVAEVYFRALLPAVVAAWGYAPSWVAGGEPLPAGVARQWRRWGLRRGWAYSDPAMQAHRQADALAVPVHLWSFADDLTYAPPRAVDALAAQFRNAAVQRHHVHPRDVGQSSLGHFGAFRRAPGPRLWERLLAPIEAAAPGLQR